MFALRTCANIVSFLLVTKSEIGAERLPIWEASGKCSGMRARLAGAFVCVSILGDDGVSV